MITEAKEEEMMHEIMKIYEKSEATPVEIITHMSRVLHAMSGALLESLEKKVK